MVPGDTCDGISAKEGVSSFQLANVNKQIDAACFNPEIGEVLCLGIIGRDCQVVHVVGSADTCVTIAHAAGTTLDILLFANNPNVKRDCTNIAPGEVLCTADDVIVGSPPVVTSISTITVTPPVVTSISTITVTPPVSTLPGSTTTLPGSTTTTTISVTVTVPPRQTATGLHVSS